MNNKIIKKYSVYGNIEEIKKVKEPGKSKVILYRFVYNMKRLFPESSVPNLSFMIIERNESIIMQCFFFRDKINDENKDKIYEVINSANYMIKYGKFILDDDNDICWECSFSLDSIEEVDMDEYARNVLDGLYCIVKKDGDTDEPGEQ